MGKYFPWTRGLGIGIINVPLACVSLGVKLLEMLISNVDCMHVDSFFLGLLFLVVLFEVEVLIDIHKPPLNEPSNQY